MPQFFTDQQLKTGSDITIRGSEAHHILDVLRLGKGDWIVLSDGRGHSFRTTIVDTGTKTLTVRIEAEIDRRAGLPPPALAIACIKPERLEWAVQKCVELGSCHILPFVSARTVKKIAEGRTAAKIDRLRRIAMSAAKQSGLPTAPTVEDPIDFASLCGRIPDFSPSILFYEGEQSRDLRQALMSHAAKPGDSSQPLLIIGPEGGFTDREVALAADAGAISASLGEQILRVETAAVATMAICQFELGNMNAPLATP